jgi:hypothetical protein
MDIKNTGLQLIIVPLKLPATICVVVLFSYIVHVLVRTDFNEAYTMTNFSSYKHSLTFRWLLQTRYATWITKNVDIKGRNFDTSTASPFTITVLTKRARLPVKANVNDHFSTNFIINIAAFNGNPSNKVLENTFVKYSLNKHLNLQAGQFRPFIGEGGLPVKYYAEVNNGNNQATDNDDTKNAYVWLEFHPLKRLTTGANAASASFGSATANACGGDFSGRIDLSKKCQLLMAGEHKSGNNFTLYNSTPSPHPDLDDFRMQGLYVLPILRFEYQKPRARAIAFSSRYKYFDENCKQNSSLRDTIIPNVGLICVNDFFVTLQAGSSINFYTATIPLTMYNNHGLFYTQLQCVSRTNKLTTIEMQTPKIPGMNEIKSRAITLTAIKKTVDRVFYYARLEVNREHDSGIS